MYKAFLLILCLLVNTTMVVAQRPDTRRPAPSPVRQQGSPPTPIVTKEQLERLRLILQPFLEKEYGSAHGAVTLPNQNPLTPFARMSPLGGLLEVTEDPNLRKYGPLGPNVNYGPMGPLGEGQGVQSLNAQSNPGVVWKSPSDFTLDKVFSQMLDGINQAQNGINQSLDGVNGALGALNQVQQQIAAFNVLTMPSSKSVVQTLMPPFDRVSRSCLEQIKKDPTIRCVTDDYAYLRSDPKSFFVNTLQYGDYFRVLARHYVKEKCWYYGDAFGSVNQHHIWIECDHLDGLDIHPDPIAAKEPQYHEPGPDKGRSVSTREYLETRYGTLLFETPQCNNGFWLVQPRLLDGSASNRIDIYSTRDPETGKLSKIRKTVDFTTTDATIRARYITSDGSAAVVNVRLPGQTFGEGLWGFAEIGRIRFVEPKKVPQNDNLLVKCQ
jgi:hypothetical protein